MESVGWLDTQYTPGNADDADWCYRAHLEGWRMAIVDIGEGVHHEGSKSFGKSKLRIQKENQRKLIEKYTLTPN
jgi:GT2 family glycosyltransferase